MIRKNKVSIGLIPDAVNFLIRGEYLYGYYYAGSGTCTKSDQVDINKFGRKRRRAFKKAYRKSDSKI
jgi:hypothetical protein